MQIVHKKEQKILVVYKKCKLSTKKLQVIEKENANSSQKRNSSKSKMLLVHKNASYRQNKPNHSQKMQVIEQKKKKKSSNRNKKKKCNLFTKRKLSKPKILAVYKNTSDRPNKPNHLQKNASYGPKKYSSNRNKKCK